MQQLSLFLNEPVNSRKPKSQTKLELIIKELGKELEKTKPLTQREEIDAAVEEGIRICNEFIEQGVSRDTILWVLGDEMYKLLKERNEEDEKIYSS